MTRITLGPVTLTRVPYFDTPLDPAVVGCTREELQAIPWAAPTWADNDGNVHIGQAVWVIESAGTVVVIDPCGAADAFIRTGENALLHQDAVATALRDAGFPVERVDTVFLTHLDGIGMTAAVDTEGEWVPMFPNARVLITEEERDVLAGAQADGTPGIDAFRTLQRAGVVDAIADGTELASGVRVELTGGHGPGHAVVRITGDHAQAVMMGHLALNPVQLARDQEPQQHVDATRANQVINELVAAARADGTVLIGSLWPAPGAATIGADGDVVPLAGV